MLKRILNTTAATLLLLPILLTSCAGPADRTQDSTADTTTAAVVQDTTTEAPETTVPAPVSLTLLDGKKSENCFFFDGAHHILEIRIEKKEKL